ncbi:MAG: magnesium chelatase subunit D [Hyphomicrobiaceae bacterium]|nr:magnesium chelatase subunit D [Hyphomicrobiaceae bacterium]
MPDAKTASGAGAALSDADWAAAIVAMDPAVVGGVVIRARHGEDADSWLRLLRGLLSPGTPVRRVPGHITDDRLLGGLDLAATLAAGRPMVASGLLAEADGGLLVLPLAERVAAATAAHLAAARDLGEVLIERDGFTCRARARFGVIALNEGRDDEQPPANLTDRLAIHIDLAASPPTADAGALSTLVDRARSTGADVTISTEITEAICGAAVSLGIGSLTASVFAVRVARIAAALAGRTAVAEDDVILAARLVLGPRATTIPASPEQPEEQSAPDASDGQSADDETTGELKDVAVEAARASLPPGLLAQLTACANRSNATGAGRSKQPHTASRRGRSVGVKRGPPSGGARLNLIETLRAAAPWQRMRRQNDRPGRVEVRADDFRVRRLKQQVAATTIFLVDASGSSALHRLGEAKGAVELLLADCYVRRDQVAMIAFSGRGAEVLLPPTRSLARARRSLADLPGGGGTPLAAGIDATALMVEAVKRKGQAPGVVILTDGKANLTRAGTGGRSVAEEEALTAARAMRLLNAKAIVIDTSPQPQPQAARVADALGARYLPLPRADAETLCLAVKAQQDRRGA